MTKILENKVGATVPQNSKEAYRRLLKSISLFSEFDEGDIGQLLKKSILKNYRKDKLLFFNGDKAEYFYVIANGWVKLFRETRDGHEVVISVLTRGDTFGKAAILNNSSLTYSAEAISDAVALQIPSTFMMEMAKGHTHFDGFLAKFLEAQLEETNQLCLETEHLAQMTSAQRVGCFLLKMCAEKHKGSITLQLPYEKSLVARRLGMTPETFSRSLNQLASLGVETKLSRVTIHNIEQLQAHICEHCSAIKKDVCST